MRALESAASSRHVIIELTNLAQRIARGRQIEILRQLLRDRAGAAQRRPALDAGLDRLLDLRDVDALVIEEGAVLGGEHGPAQVHGDPRVRHPAMHPLHRPAGARGLALAQLHERGAGRIRRGERPHVGQREVGVRDHTERNSADASGHAKRSLDRRGTLHPLTTILIRAPTRGRASGAVWFITARAVGRMAPAERSASDAHVSPSRTV